MRSLQILVFAPCLVLAACGGSDVAVPEGFAQDPIPSRFRHVWAEQLIDCPQRSSPTRLSIDPSTINFAVGRFDVLSTREVGKTELQINVSARGGLAQRHTLELGDEAQTLVYRSPATTQTFHRCPDRGEPVQTAAVVDR